MRTKLVIITTVVTLLGTFLFAPFVAAAPLNPPLRVKTDKLREAVTLESIQVHLQAFQAIADANNGTRAAGTPGYDASAQYVYDTLQAAGYEVSFDSFEFNFYQQLAPSTFEQTTPNNVTYVTGQDFETFEFSGSGEATGNIVPTNDIQIPPSPTPGSTSGCEAEDFPAATAGNIALVQRGTCTFGVKVANAVAAGAVGVLIFNEGQPGRTAPFAGTLGGPVSVPVLSPSFALGQSLYELVQSGQTVTVRLETETASEIRTTNNVIADTPRGRPNHVVVVGAHLDSVLEGPGINDNGSGIAAILEVAVQMAELKIRPKNKVRFAFWGAEESGLVGSTAYVNKLVESGEIRNIQLNLNFDMVGSPNYVLGVYDGDGSAFELEGPDGSDAIEQVFVDFFESQDRPTVPTEFSGRSDYQAFILNNIPAGGLFTGAEGIKTAEEAALFGGEAGVAYDPNYHAVGDTITNVNLEALDINADAIAHATLAFAQRTLPRPKPVETAAVQTASQQHSTVHHNHVVER